MNSVRVALVRHGESNYNNYLVHEQGGDPTTYIDYRKQVADLNRHGLHLVRARAIEFARQFNSITQQVRLLSSGEMRAYQTAHIYLEELVRAGIAVGEEESIPARYLVGVDTQKNAKFEEEHNRVTLDGRIIPVEWASLHYRAVWIQDLFEPPEGSKGTTFTGLDTERLREDEKKDYDLARNIIRRQSDTSLSWGDNWFRYHRQFPFNKYTPTLEDNLSRILSGLDGIMAEKYGLLEQDGKETVFVIMTHEENVIGLIQSYFDATRFPNCASLELEIPTDPHNFMTGKYNGRKTEISSLYTHRLEKGKLQI